jgi:hypothetical protein
MSLGTEIGHRQGNLARERKMDKMKHLRPISKASLDGTKQLTPEQILSVIVTLITTLSSIIMTIFQSKAPAT